MYSEYNTGSAVLLMIYLNTVAFIASLHYNWYPAIFLINLLNMFIAPKHFSQEWFFCMYIIYRYIIS